MKDLPCCIGILTDFHHEREIPDVMETERNQTPFNKTINSKSKYRVLIGSPFRKILYCTSNWRPYK